MLLWTIIERFCTLKYGADISPADKIKALGSDLTIPWEEIINNIEREDRIYRSDKVNEDEIFGDITNLKVNYSRDYIYFPFLITLLFQIFNSFFKAGNVTSKSLGYFFIWFKRLSR